MKTLIVEDDMMSQCVLAKILEERGHEVVSFDNAELAILAYQKEFYPLVFVDVELPGMDGLQFSKWVRAQPNGERVFIMLATSSGQPEDVSEVLTAGANDFLAKPYEVNSLGVRLTVAERQMQEFFERKDLEDALRGSRECFDRVVKTANEGAWLLDAQFRTEYVNPQMAAMIGYQAEELAGRPVLDFLAESAQGEAEWLFAQQRDGQDVKLEFRFRHKDRSECLALISAAPVRADNGEFKGSLWMVADLTGRQCLEIELADTQKKSEAQARDLTAELNKTRESLETESFDRKQLEQTLQKARQELSDELSRTKAALDAEVHQRQEDQEALLRLREELEARILEQEDHLAMAATELKAEQAAKKQLEQELLQAREDIARRVKEHVAEMIKSGDELKAVLADRKQLEETLSRTRQEMELQVAERTTELARVRELLSAESGERQKLGARFGELSAQLNQARMEANERDAHVAGVESELEARNGALGRVSEELKSEMAARQRAEARSAALLKLGRDLGTARTPGEAARVMAGVAHELVGWDACGFDLYSAEENKISPLLHIDTVNGRPAEVPPTYSGPDPNPLMRRVIKEGPQLILRSAPSDSHMDYVLFGDRARLSASLMYVAIRTADRILGFLAVHSYAPGAYRDQDLDTLQTLADQCGGALERIRTEEQRRTQAAMIEGEARAAALLEAVTGQAQKMESVRRLAAGIAHDFNNLLGIVQGYSSLLMEEPGLKPEMAEAAQQIASATERASHLTSQLLAFSGSQVAHHRTIDLNELINNVGKLMRRALGESAALQFNFSPNLPAVEADTGQLEQVVMDLAINARDSMPEGGQLTVATKATEIDEAHLRQNPEARPGRFVCLTMTDTGCGMDEATRQRIFEPFFTTKPSGAGTGIGLAAAYGIVKQHQGWIEVQSQPGQGTTFNIFLPLSTAAVSPARMETKLLARGGTETILLVEDEPAVLSMARGILARLGYQVLTAASGDEAVPIWRQNAARIDLLLTDMVMPGSLSGRELAEKLLQERPGLQVVYTSGYSKDLVGPGLATSRNFVFLQKPYHPDVLAQRVRNCLDARPGFSA